VAVQRADADAGFPRDRVERDLRAVARERPDGDVQQPGPIALRAEDQGG
jgi:hypothetical protein